MVIILDSANLERNLYLAVQVLELGVRGIIVLNMMDIADSYNIKIDKEQLSKLIGVPVVTTIASKGVGISDLIDCIINTAKEVEP